MHNGAHELKGHSNHGKLRCVVIVSVRVCVCIGCMKVPPLSLSVLACSFFARLLNENAGAPLRRRVRPANCGVKGSGMWALKRNSLQAAGAIGRRWLGL